MDSSESTLFFFFEKACYLNEACPLSVVVAPSNQELKMNVVIRLTELNFTVFKNVILIIL